MTSILQLDRIYFYVRESDFKRTSMPPAMVNNHINLDKKKISTTDNIIATTKSILEKKIVDYHVHFNTNLIK